MAKKKEESKRALGAVREEIGELEFRREAAGSLLMRMSGHWSDSGMTGYQVSESMVNTYRRELLEEKEIVIFCDDCFTTVVGMRCPECKSTHLTERVRRLDGDPRGDPVPDHGAEDHKERADRVSKDTPRGGPPADLDQLEDLGAGEVIEDEDVMADLKKMGIGETHPPPEEIVEGIKEAGQQSLDGGLAILQTLDDIKHTDKQTTRHTWKAGPYSLSITEDAWDKADHDNFVQVKVLAQNLLKKKCNHILTEEENNRLIETFANEMDKMLR